MSQPLVTTMASTALSNHTNNFITPPSPEGIEKSTINSFDDFAKSRSRSTRAASLALPNNSNLLDLLDTEHHSTYLTPINLSPTSATIRRHSTHHYPNSTVEIPDTEVNPVVSYRFSLKLCKCDAMHNIWVNIPRALHIDSQL